MSDADRDRFFHQARREGLTLSAWLRAAAHDRLRKQETASRLDSPTALTAFFAACDERSGEGVEPDWEQHRQVIDESRGRGATRT
jgi:hypothetical protein